MAYDKEKLARLSALEALAERVRDGYATKGSVAEVAGRVETLVETGGEPNVITAVRVNGTAQEVTEKAVDITVPTKVSSLDNDSRFQDDTEVAAAIQKAIAATGHAHFEKADSVPDAATAEENVMYLVRNEKTGHYDIYALVSGRVEQLDDTTVDLSAYPTTEDMEAALGGKVDSIEGKGLSTEDYTTGEKEKLAGMEFATSDEVSEMLEAVFGAA